MGYSHRDLRVHRELAELTGLLLLGTALLISASLLVPAGPWGTLLVLALAALGGSAMIRSRRLVREYERDLRLVHAGSPEVSGRIVAEIRSSLPIDRPGPLPSGRSPHARGAARRGASDIGRATGSTFGPARSGR